MGTSEHIFLPAVDGNVTLRPFVLNDGRSGAAHGSEILFSRDVSSILWWKKCLDVIVEVVNDAKCSSRGKWELQVSLSHASPLSFALRSQILMSLHP